MNRSRGNLLFFSTSTYTTQFTGFHNVGLQLIGTLLIGTVLQVFPCRHNYSCEEVPADNDVIVFCSAVNARLLMVRLNKTKPEGYMQPLAVSVDLLLPGPSFFLHRGASSTKQPTLCLKATRFVPEEWASCRRSLNAALLNDRNRGVIRLVSPQPHPRDLCHTFTSAGLV
jgi:hypothetical protein